MKRPTFESNVDNIQSDLKSIEVEKLNASTLKESHFRMLVENSTGLITISNEDGQFTYCSPNIKKILGYTEEALLNKRVLDLIPEKHHNSVNETLRSVFCSPDCHFTFVHQYLSSTKGYLIVESIARATVNEEGQKILIMNSCDITEKFESGKKMRTADEILNRVNSLVIMVNLHNEISYVSPSVKKVLGFEPEELLGKEWWKKTAVNSADAELREMHNESLLKSGIVEKNFYNERALLTKQGKIKWIAWEKSRVADGSIIGVGQDITEIKKLEREKEEIQKKAFSSLEELVAQRTQEVVSQRKIIEQKNKDFTDSIRYAKKLQDAIHPSIEHLSSVFSENFIFYRPKDIVSGDFFWAHESDNHFMIAVADCTGHGVPGAMVSVVCSNALERAVNEYQLVDPGEILDLTTELVMETFYKNDAEREYSSEHVSDGMDISLLIINKITKQIFWAGANNPLYFLQDKQLKKLLPNKQPVGSFIWHLPFTTQQVDNYTGTTFYLLSDGFADQFGGPNEKKFMKRRLAKLLFDTGELPLCEQYEIIKKVFFDWKGNLEQIDDVTLVGLRVDSKFTFGVQ